LTKKILLSLNTSHIGPKNQEIIDPMALSSGDVTSQVSRATCTLLLTLATASFRRQRCQRYSLGLAAPKALQPAAPEGGSSGQVELPDFWQYAATLEEAPGLHGTPVSKLCLWVKKTGNWENL
jgi:hypothetical protein